MTASHVLMIRPVNFGYNVETAVNNAFQQLDIGCVQNVALQEFNLFVELLNEYNIKITVFDDTQEPHTPDSIFPNNWISFHGDTICLFPMFAENRRQERKALDKIIKKICNIRHIIDFTYYEKQGKFLEGTGSMVLDRINCIAYACLSPRTDKEVLYDFCRQMCFEPVVFHAADSNGKAIYHTNVMMCVANEFAVVCMECIADIQEQAMLAETLTATGKEIIPISMSQMERFAGNMLQLQNRIGEQFLLLSTTALNSLTNNQITILKKYNNLITPNVLTIERNGGGSVRCMVAEIF